MRLTHFFSATSAILAVLQIASTAEAISIPSGPFAYSQDFDSLATSGTANSWTNDSTIPGWSLFKQPASNPVAIATYRASTGSDTSGAMYSLGNSSDRALGGIGSNSLASSGSIWGWMAVAFQNDTGGTLSQFTLGYDGEQWRNGGNTTQQNLTLEYAFGASFPTTGWNIAGTTFDFNSPINTASAATLDGNLAANKVTGLGGTISGLTWNNSDTLWIRWADKNDAGNDHALAIDNVTFSVPGTGGGGNNSIITTAPTLALGRVMLNQTASGNIGLTKTGSSETDYTAAEAANNDGITISPLGDHIGANAQSPNVSVQLQNNANGSQTTGVKAYTVTIDNTAADSGGAGQGSADANDVAAVSATVVDNRTVVGTISGNVIRSVPIATPITTTGDHDHFTNVTVYPAGATAGTVSVAAGSTKVFAAATDNTSRGVTFSAAGVQAGSVTLSSSGEGLTGEASNPVAIAYNTTAYDPSQAKFLSNGGNSLSVNLGSFAPNSGTHTINSADAIYDVEQTSGLTAALDFDTIIGSGSTSVLSTNLANGAFTALSAGVGNAFGFNLAFDTASQAPGTYTATYTLKLSDANLYAGAGAAGSQTLTLNLSGTITGTSPILAGDYNNDGHVDAGDYVVWRTSLASGAALPFNETASPGVTNTADYDAWRANFGSSATGGGAGLGSGTAVPEPSSIVLLMISLAVVGSGTLTQRQRARHTM